MQIGSGACSLVYKTRDGYAVKEFRDESEEYFIKELLILKNLQDENIINIIDFDFKRRRLILPLGNTTLNKISKHKFHTPRFNKTVLFQILNGVSYLHANKIWHLDIKPENILIFSGDIIKLIDFSHSMYVPYVGYTTDDDHGTPVYAPPEHWLSNNSVNEKYDVWSTAVTMLNVRGLYYTYSSEENIVNEKSAVLALPNEIKKIEFYEDGESDLYIKMLSENTARITAEQALEHLYFKDCNITNCKKDITPLKTTYNVWTREFSITTKHLLLMWLYNVLICIFRDLESRCVLYILFHSTNVLENFMHKYGKIQKTELKLYTLIVMHIILQLFHMGLERHDISYYLDHRYNVDELLETYQKILNVLDYKIFPKNLLIDKLKWTPLAGHILFKLELTVHDFTDDEKLLIAEAYPAYPKDFTDEERKQIDSAIENVKNDSDRFYKNFRALVEK